MDQFRRGSLTFDVRDGGPANGEPVVLLHGFPQDNTSWEGIEPMLHEAGFRTLAPNQRGYSPGARPEGRRAYKGDQLVDDIIALLDEAGLESAHIVGHDWGAAVAWMIACRDPERVKSLTVLSVPHPVAMTRSMRSSTQGLKSWYMGFFQIPGLPEFLIAKGNLGAGLHKMGLPRDVAEHYSEKMKEPGALTGALNWYRGLPFGTNEPIHRCPVPTTYIWGSEDSFLGRKGAEMTKSFVTGPYRFVEVKAGHWLPELLPEAMAGYIIEQVNSASATQTAVADRAARN